MNAAPALRLIADHDEYDGIFGVELWESGKGIVLDLTHEQEYEMDGQRRESLVPGLSTPGENHFLNQNYSLFPLHHFVRTKNRIKRCGDPQTHGADSSNSVRSGSRN